jgi:hypothetical protein
VDVGKPEVQHPTDHERFYNHVDALLGAVVDAPPGDQPGLSRLQKKLKKVRIAPALWQANARLRMHPRELNRVQELSGKSFTFEANCDSAAAAFCKSFPASGFQQESVSGHHVWMCPTMEEASSTLSHFIKCWQQDPSRTSGCIVLPKYLAHLIVDVAQHARVLCHYGKGSAIFQRPDSQGVFKSAGKLSFPCTVYMIDSLPEQLDNSLPGGVLDDTMLEPPTPDGVPRHRGR